MPDNSFGLYVHIPFCSKKCPYCDFNTYAQVKIPGDEYIQSLLAELDFYSRDPIWQGRTIGTVFFGGGTPSLLSAGLISRFLKAIVERFAIVSECEISLEANPSNVVSDYYKELFVGGVNRLSFGVQSFDPRYLNLLGRDHLSDQITESVNAAYNAGFSNISVDLMFGLPGQSVAEALEDVYKARQLPITHISTYSLTIEKGTPFFQRQERGLLELPHEDVVVGMLKAIPEALRDLNFTRYEISNYAKFAEGGKNWESVHNSNYWSGIDYLGLGAGAHSYVRQGKEKATRWSNCALPTDYMRKSANGEAVSWSEVLDNKGLAFEFFFLGLRKIKGVSLSAFKDEFGEEQYALALERLLPLQKEGFVSMTRSPDLETVTLTDNGIRMADSVLERLA